MNKIFTLLLVGALTAGAVTANAESQILKMKMNNPKPENAPRAEKDPTSRSCPD